MNKIENNTQLNGTSFHGGIIKTTPNDLIKLAESIGAEYNSDNSGEDKTNFDFRFMTDDGIPFSVYDWKEYRPLSLSETIEFHIGTFSNSDSTTVVESLRKVLNKE